MRKKYRITQSITVLGDPSRKVQISKQADNVDFMATYLQ